jgi:NMD protein affecting ribosome stability and mRNA decay
MNVELYKDLIKDERGNYYVAVQQEGHELTLVNAMLERSYQDLWEFNEDFNKKYAEYENQFIGKMILDKLRHDIVFASKEDGHGQMHDLAAVIGAYKVTFIDMIEFYRNPRIGQ